MSNMRVLFNNLNFVIVILFDIVHEPVRLSHFSSDDN